MHLKSFFKAGEAQCQKTSFTNQNLFDLEWHLRETSDFSTGVAESAFLGAGWLGDDSQKLIASTSASHFWCNSTCSASYFLWLVLSSSLISHSLHPTFFFKSSLARVFLLLLFHLKHHPCISPLPLHFLVKSGAPRVTLFNHTLCTLLTSQWYCWAAAEVIFSDQWTPQVRTLQ